jgi:hypothetical protein
VGESLEEDCRVTIEILPLVCLLLAMASASGAKGLFEVTQLLKLPVGDHGYRGIMGDFIRLK